MKIFEDKLQEVAHLEELLAQQEAKERSDVSKTVVMSEIDRLTVLMEEKARELEQMRQSKHAEITKIKNEYEAKLSSMAARVNSLSLNNSEEIQRHSHQGEQVKRGGNVNKNDVSQDSVVQEQGQEIQRLKEQCQHLGEVIKELEAELRDHEEKKTLLINEVEKLGAVLNEIQDDNEALNRKLHDMAEVHAKQLSDREKQYQQMTKSQVENDVSSLQKGFTKEKSELEAKIHRYELKIHDLEESIGVVKTELARLQQANVNKAQESEAWRIKHDEVTRENKVLKDNLDGELRKKLVKSLKGKGFLIMNRAKK